MDGGEMRRPRRRWILVAGGLVLIGLLAVVVVLWLTVSEPAPVEAGLDAAQAGPADSATPDLAPPPPDIALTPDRRRRPRPKRIIEPREQRRLLRRYGASLRVCYSRVARRARSMVAGRAEVTVNLADFGKVRSVTVSAGGDRALEGCLRRAVRGWRFSSSLKAQQVRFPVIFR